jgi:hypothetical protein
MRQTLIININGEKVFFCVLAAGTKRAVCRAPNNKDNKTHSSDKKEY